jgi:hypothetical protein
MPDLARNDLIAEAQEDILEELCRRSKLGGFQRESRTPWGMLALYRTVAAELLGERAKPLLKEADAVHRRFLFAQGVALASTLLALQCCARLVFWYLPAGWRDATFLTLHLPPMRPLPEYIHPVALFFIAVLGFAASYGLRRVAARWWESAFELTCILLRDAEALPPPPPHVIV